MFLLFTFNKLIMRYCQVLMNFCDLLGFIILFRASNLMGILAFNLYCFVSMCFKDVMYATCCSGIATDSIMVVILIKDALNLQWVHFKLARHVDVPWIRARKMHYVTFLWAVNKQENRVLDARNSSLQELTWLLDVLKSCTNFCCNF